MNATPPPPEGASPIPPWPPVAIPGQQGRHAPDTSPVGAAGQPSPEVAPVSPPEPMDWGTGEGSHVLGQLRSQVARFVILPSTYALNAVTLWVAATHLQPAWEHAPRLAVVGPAKRCGKSRLLDVLTETVHEPM